MSLNVILNEIRYAFGRGLQSACLLVFLFSSLFCDSLDIEVESAYRITFAGDIGYTLIGEKPVAHEHFPDMYLCTHSYVYKKFIPSLIDTFKNTDKFVLKVFNIGDDMYEVELIHRKALRDTVSKSDFLKRYIQDVFQSEEEFCVKIEDVNTSIFEFNSDIRGILFGYGKESTEHFGRIATLAHHLKKYPYVSIIEKHISRVIGYGKPNFPESIDLPYIAKVPELSFGFESLESEWEWLKSVDLDIVSESEAIPPYFVNSLFYRCRRSAESEAIRAKYMQARAKLAHIFCGKSYQQAVFDEVHKK